MASSDTTSGPALPRNSSPHSIFTLPPPCRGWWGQWAVRPSSTDLQPACATNSSNSFAYLSSDWLGFSWELETRVLIGGEFPLSGWQSRGRRKMWRRYSALRSPDGDFVPLYNVDLCSLPLSHHSFLSKSGGENHTPAPYHPQHPNTLNTRNTTQFLVACESVWKFTQSSGKHFCICTSVSWCCVNISHHVRPLAKHTTITRTNEKSKPINCVDRSRGDHPNPGRCTHEWRRGFATVAARWE